MTRLCTCACICSGIVGRQTNRSLATRPDKQKIRTGRKIREKKKERGLRKKRENKEQELNLLDWLLDNFCFLFFLFIFYLFQNFFFLRWALPNSSSLSPPLCSPSPPPPTQSINHRPFPNHSHSHSSLLLSLSTTTTSLSASFPSTSSLNIHLPRDGLFLIRAVR